MKTRIPLLKDHHTHPSQYAAFRSCLNLGDVTEKEKVMELIDGLDEDFSIVLGWRSGQYDLEKSELDDHHPIIVCDLSFHGFLVNDAAREMMAEEHPDIVENLDDEDWLERNLPMFMKNLVRMSPPSKEDLLGFYKDLLDMGVWYAEEMLVPDEETMELFYRCGLQDRTSFWTDFDTYEKMGKKARDKLKGIKIFTDGALGSRTAAMKEPFIDGDEGILLHSDEELKTLVKKVNTIGKKASIHAIGDRATHQVVRVLGDMEDIPETRIEHVQFISKEDAFKAKELGLKICMQPNFNRDSVDYSDRLSQRYLEENNPFRMLIDEVGFVPGEDLLLGSDGMPHGAYEALRSVLFPPHPGQRLSLEEFSSAYCLEDESHGHIDIEVDEENEELDIDILI